MNQRELVANTCDQCQAWKKTFKGETNWLSLFSAIAFSLSSRPGHICCCSVFLVCVFFVLFLPTALGVATFISRDGSRQKLAKDVSQGGDRSEAWDRETMFSQLAKRSSQNVDSGVRRNKYFRSTINSFEIVFRIYLYFVGGK